MWESSLAFPHDGCILYSCSKTYYYFPYMPLLCSVKCAKDCENGGTCVGQDECHCKEGWTGRWCQDPECEPACVNGATCSKPNHCICPPGVSGEGCSIGNIWLHFATRILTRLFHCSNPGTLLRKNKLLITNEPRYIFTGNKFPRCCLNWFKVPINVSASIFSFMENVRQVKFLQTFNSKFFLQTRKLIKPHRKKKSWEHMCFFPLKKGGKLRTLLKPFLPSCYWIFWPDSWVTFESCMVCLLAFYSRNS